MNFGCCWIRMLWCHKSAKFFPLSSMALRFEHALRRQNLNRAASLHASRLPTQLWQIKGAAPTIRLHLVAFYLIAFLFIFALWLSLALQNPSGGRRARANTLWHRAAESRKANVDSLFCAIYVESRKERAVRGEMDPPERGWGKWEAINCRHESEAEKEGDGKPAGREGHSFSESEWGKEERFVRRVGEHLK